MTSSTTSSAFSSTTSIVSSTTYGRLIGRAANGTLFYLGLCTTIGSGVSSFATLASSTITTGAGNSGSKGASLGLAAKGIFFPRVTTGMALVT